MIVWSDGTSYQHGERGKKEPTCTCAEIGKFPNNLRISVVWGHRAMPDRWVFHCPQLSIDTEWLPKAKNMAHAQMMALETVRVRLESMLIGLIDQWPGK